MTNKTLAPDYQGCEVKTKALFWSSDAGSFAMLAGNKPDMVVFQVSDPAVGEGSYIPVRIPKNASDLVFQLKKGDTVVLTGGTAPPQTASNMAVPPGTFPWLIAASKIERAPATGAAGGQQ